MRGKPPKTPLTLVGNRPETDAIPVPKTVKLGRSGTNLWRSIQSEFRIEDAGGVALLMQACLTADRAQALADYIDVDGEIIKGKSGLRAHPAIREELACRALFCRILARLGVTNEPIKAVGRPSTGGVGWRGPLYGDE
jgi:hypothetical protein